MANPFTIDPPDALRMLMMSKQGLEQGRERGFDLARSEAAKEIATNPQGALARLLGASDLQGAKLAGDLIQTQAGQGGVYGTPIYGTDEKGNPVLGAMDKRGGFRRLDTGGVTVNPGIRTVDTGTGTMILNSRTGQQMPGGMARPGQAQGGAAPGFIPKNNQQESLDKRLGQEQGDRIADFGKAKAGLDSALSSMGRLKEFAMRVKSAPGLGGITGVQGMFPNWPGGNAANANALLGTLKSQVAFGVLQAMREASKTGGALGAVSDAEGKRLENNLAALDQAQDINAFKKAMDDIVKYTDEVIPRLQGAFKQDYESLRSGGQSQAAPASAPVPDARQAPDGNFYVPDPSRPGKYLKVN